MPNQISILTRFRRRSLGRNKGNGFSASFTALLCCGMLWTGAAFAVSPDGAPTTPSDRKAAPMRPLVVATLGGAMQDAMQKAFFAPFSAQTHIGIRADVWDGLLSTLQAQARAGADLSARALALMDNASVQAACRQGLLLPIDATRIPGMTDGAGRMTQLASRCGIGAFRMNLVLAWDKSRIDSVPGWADFWDVARRPGKRGLARDPRAALEIALLADGVAADDVPRTLESGDGIDRAFRKLDQLKPYIVWWDTPDQAVHIIEAGAVLMTSAPNDAVAAADLVGHRDFGIQWQQSISRMLSWAMPGRDPLLSPLTEPAASEEADRIARGRALLGFMLDPARQADFLSRFPAVGLLSAGDPSAANLPQDSPATPDHQRDALREDDAFWATHLPVIQARFDAWISE